MCGITGYIGYKEATPALLAMLQKLEYRGYDSAGIAVLCPCGGENGGGSAEKHSILVRKMKGELRILRQALAGERISGTMGIGHTRWATHGEPSDINSHPQTNTAGSIAVVHNGIIENYQKLKNYLQERGVVFRSETDTEVIAHLLNYYYTKETAPLNENVYDKLLNAVLKTMARLEGSYSLGIIASDYSDRIIAVRKDSPLIVGAGRDENFIASDVPALLPYTREVFFLDDGEAAVLFRDHIDIFNSSGEKVIKSPVHIEWDAEAAEKGGYAHFMLKEINEQPKALRDTLSPRLVKVEGGQTAGINLEELKVDGAFADAQKIFITACGTAYYAAVAGKYIFERFARQSCDVDIASEFRYRDPIIGAGDILLVISQSGETADTLAAMRLAKKRGARIFAITNAVGSTLSREADYALYTWAGPEIAVASTKAFTTQIMCLYLLALASARLRGKMNDEEYKKTLEMLQTAPEQMRTLLSKQSAIQKFAALNFNKNKVFFIGRLFDYPIALESALKLKEISYTHSEAFAAGELKHGAIALVDSGTLVVAIAQQPALYEKIISNIREVASRGAQTLVIAPEGDDCFEGVASSVFYIPKTMPEVSPLLSVAPLQLFAYYCAVQKGNNPDKPRNLAKSVTVE